MKELSKAVEYIRSLVPQNSKFIIYYTKFEDLMKTQSSLNVGNPQKSSSKILFKIWLRGGINRGANKAVVRIT